MSADGASDANGASQGPDITTLKPTLSAREQEILMAAWLSIKGPEPQINYEKLAIILGLKNAHTASTIFYNVKKKVKQFQAQSGDAANEPKANSGSTSAKSTPRKRTKTAPKSGKPAKRVKTEAAASGEEEDAI